MGGSYPYHINVYLEYLENDPQGRQIKKREYLETLDIIVAQPCPRFEFNSRDLKDPPSGVFINDSLREIIKDLENKKLSGK